LTDVVTAEVLSDPTSVVSYIRRPDLLLITLPGVLQGLRAREKPRTFRVEVSCPGTGADNHRLVFTGTYT
jgi:hypothetical protein